jgi:hypothetical protein
MGAAQKEKRKTSTKTKVMKNLTKAIVAALLLSGSTLILPAQSNTAACPLGNEPGYGRTLTPEQRAEHRAAMQKLVADLQAKAKSGVLTAEEEALLAQIEQRGGMCLTGTPRGCGMGQGRCAGNGAGQGMGMGMRRGLRDGTGPRSLDGTCVNPGTPANAAPQAPKTAPKKTQSSRQ